MESQVWAASTGLGIGEAWEVPRVQNLRRHSLSGLTLNLHDLESECLLKSCSLGALLPHQVWLCI